MSCPGSNGGLTAATDPDWQTAWCWLRQRRRQAPVNADIWDIWFHWPQEGPRLYQQVNTGTWRLSPLQVFRRRHGGTVAVWSARDALVLKWLTLKLQRCLPVHDNCLHVAGHHGGRDSLQQVARAIQGGAAYVYRTDIRGYYRHIRKEPLYHQVCRHVGDPVLRDLVHQYLYYSVEEGGEFYTPETGISRGCSLSPLMGAVLLRYVDRYFAQTEGIRYVRYMDDFLILSDRRWPVRRARTRLLAFLSADGFEPHPDKTQVGKVSRGFDWLGFWFTDRGVVGVSPRAQENHRLRLLRLEERSRRSGLSEEATARRMQQYEARWKIWNGGTAVDGYPLSYSTYSVRPTGRRGDGGRRATSWHYRNTPGVTPVLRTRKK